MRVLLTCHDIPGHLNPNMALAESLVERGNEVAIYSGSLARKPVESCGYRYFPFNPQLDQHIKSITLPADGISDMATVATRRSWAFRYKALNRTLSDWLVNSIPQQIDDLQKIISQYSPDIIVTDSTVLGPILVLREISPIPVAVFSILAGCTIPGPQAPIWGIGLPSPNTFMNRLLCNVSEFVISGLTRGVRENANRIRKQYDLPPLGGRVADQYSHVPLFMVTSTPSLDYNRTDLPACVKYVGACSWDSPNQLERPKWLDQFDGSRKLVHVTEGTIHTNKPLLLHAAAQGLNRLPVEVVMTTGKHRKPSDLDLGPIGTNIRVEQFVPHSALFKQTDIVLTTGGAGTITKALIAGIPLIVVPAGWELPENAQRVFESGAGIRINPKKCTPSSVRQAVEAVLENPTFAVNAKRVGEDLIKEGGSMRAAELIEELEQEKRQTNLNLTKTKKKEAQQ